MQRANPAQAVKAAGMTMAAAFARANSIKLPAAPQRIYYDPGERPMPRNHQQVPCDRRGPDPRWKVATMRIRLAQRKRARRCARNLRLVASKGFHHHNHT